MTYNVFSGTLNPTHFTPPVVAKRSPISATAEHLLGLGLVFVHLFTFSILFVFWFSLGYFVLVFFAFVVFGLLSSILNHKIGWEEHL